MSGKYITLITGGNNGIGFQTAIALGKFASNHIIIGSRSISKGQDAVTELISQKELSATYSLQQLDVTSKESISAAAKAITETHGHIDCLFNNAGIVADSSLSLPDQLRQVFETNTIGPAAVTEAFTPLLLASKQTPRLVYTSSSLGSITYRNDPGAPVYDVPTKAYRMSKAALNMLVACDRFELEPKGVKVFSVCPGFVVTNLGGNPDLLKNMGAGDAAVSGATLSAIVMGERDAEVGQFLNKDKSHPW